ADPPPPFRRASPLGSCVGTVTTRRTVPAGQTSVYTCTRLPRHSLSSPGAFMRTPYVDRAALAVVSFFCLWLAGCAGGGSTPPGCGNGTGEAGCGGSTPGPVCGNGVVEAGEQCDDGNTKSGDGCSSTCQKESSTPVCGNGVVEAGEQCDDGNTKSGDGCSSTCQKEAVCGNGVVEAGEQ